ncbi:MAG: hypothetical protein Q4C91_10645 [Eubacteriales bacterium]|nr:hypothetical protein [Eubacteriales bacterium]
MKENHIADYQQNFIQAIYKTVAAAINGYKASNQSDKQEIY